MQEEANVGTVDIDTSGPSVDVELENESKETETPEVESPVEETAETKVEATEEKKEEPKEADKKENELEQYSESVQRRIAKLTHKWREAERQKDEAAEFARAQIKLKEAAEAKISKLEPGFLKSTEDSITSGIQAAQAKLAAAREANDLGAEAEALTAISELGYKKAKLEETKVAQEEFKKNKKPEPELKLNPQQQQAPDPKAEQWAARNSWFGTDNAMTYTAFDLHKKLTEQEGYDPQSDEYYQEIDKRIRLEFPHKFDTTKSETGETTTKPVQTVASAKRSTNTGRKTVRLTPSQVAIAKKLGVPLEEYAKQLKITKEV
jgi:hypothetical protein